MEPPVKKRRVDASPSLGGDVSDLGGDFDLALESQDLPASHDALLQLTIDRARADHRLQATMAHIFEKYSRNFEGIGDEIDMETGRIIVDNGHLRSMRNEVDVGGEEWIDSEQASSFDYENNTSEQGALSFEDLIDERSFLENTPEEDEQMVEAEAEPQTTTGAAAEAESGSESESETEMEMEAEAEHNEEEGDLETKEPSQSSSTVPVLPKALPQPTMTNAMVTTQTPELGPGSASAAMAQVLGGLLPFSNQAIQNAMQVPWVPLFQNDSRNGQQGIGMLPVNLGPPAGFPGAAFFWGYFGLPNNSSLPTGGQPNAQLPPVTPSPIPPHPEGSVQKYEFPPQQGSTSIWAPKSRLESDDGSRLKHLGRRAQRTIFKSRSKRGPGRPRKLLEAPTSDTTEVKEKRKPGRPPKQPKTTKEQDDYHEVSDTNDGDSVDGFSSSFELTSDDNEEGSAHRRRSVRARKQVEYMGKVTWQMAIEEMDGIILDEQNAFEQAISLKSPKSPKSPTEHEDNTGNQESGIDPENSEHAGEPSTQSLSQEMPSCPEDIATRESRGEANIVPTSRVIPDSQDSATPQSSAIQGVQPQDKRPSPKPAAQPDTNDALTLSDDEAPIVRSKSGTISSHVNESVQPQSVTIEPEVAETREETTAPKYTGTPVKRGRGRPRKSDVLSATSTVNATESPSIRTTTRKRGRPRKSEARQNPEGGPPDMTLMPIDTPMKTAKKADTSKEVGTGKERDTTKETDTPKKADTSKEADTPEGPEVPSLISIEQEDHHLEEEPSALGDISPNPRKTLANSAEPKSSPAKPIPQLASPSNKHRGSPTPTTPHTPRHTTIRTSHAPSSRRSILSLVADSDSDCDELGIAEDTTSLLPSSAPTRKLWHSSVNTTEVWSTPAKRHLRNDSKGLVSPSNPVKTPGGTSRRCGVDGFQCRRDFCFNCL